MRSSIIFGSRSLLITCSELLQENRRLCHKAYDGITELAEAFAKMMRDHGGKKRSSPFCNDLLTLNYISYENALRQGK